MRVRLHVVLGSIALGVAVVCSTLLAQAPTPVPANQPASGAAPGQETPAFRAGTTLVPLDVRVLDSKGRPITDLTQSDFRVFENGAPQEVRHFSVQELKAEPALKDAPLRRADSPSVLAPQNFRVFLIYLGRGDVNGPAGGVDGIIHFVRDRLLPQDRVAIFAWNRSTDLTTDRASTLAVLERFKQQYRGVERQLSEYFKSPAWFYGSRQVPAWAQKSIDNVFHGPEGAATRTLSTGALPQATQMERDVRDQYDLFNASPSDSFAQARLETMGLSLEEFASETAQTMQDQSNLYAAIEYLRHVDGEKHLVYVAEYGLQLSRWEFDRNLGRAAADARVVLDVLRTGGTVFVGAGAAEQRTPSRGLGPAAIRSMQPAATSRLIAELTGGRSDANRMSAAKSTDLIDDSSRFYYLLGYYPANQRWDGRFRQVTVAVNRPGATVMYRHGYYASEPASRIDRQSVMTYGRMMSAATTAIEIPDIRITGGASLSSAGAVALNVTLDISRIHFESAAGSRTASVEVAAFCIDDHQRPLGEAHHTVSLTFTDARYADVLKSGAPVAFTIPVTGVPEAVKVVVYDYRADLTGSVNLKLPKR
ncbi:MAG: VWA domain-containing protein [Vicinamibacterales bacterium]